MSQTEPWIIDELHELFEDWPDYIPMTLSTL